LNDLEDAAIVRSSAGTCTLGRDDRIKETTASRMCSKRRYEQCKHAKKNPVRPTHRYLLLYAIK
jgi:hypothetical protein